MEIIRNFLKLGRWLGFYFLFSGRRGQDGWDVCGWKTGEVRIKESMSGWGGLWLCCLTDACVRVELQPTKATFQHWWWGLWWLFVCSPGSPICVCSISPPLRTLTHLKLWKPEGLLIRGVWMRFNCSHSLLSAWRATLQYSQSKNFAQFGRIFSNYWKVFSSSWKKKKSLNSMHTSSCAS